MVLSCGVLLLLAGNASAQSTTITGLQSQDIGTDGSYTLLGSGSTDEVAPGDYDMVAGGADIWGNADGFHYAYQQMNTPFLDLRVQVQYLQDGVDVWSKAGIMVREDLTPGSRHIMNIVTPQDGTNAWVPQVRPVANEASFRWQDGTDVAGLDYPNVWVRLTRANDLFTSYWSTDGEEWTQIVQYTLDLPENAYVGLALTSHNNSDDPSVGLANAEFRNFHIVDTPHILNVETGQEISFDAHSPSGEIDPESIRVTLNGADRTGDVTVSGSGSTVSVTLGGLQENRYYSLEAEASDLNGLVATTSMVFDTLDPEGNFTWEANDWNYGGGQFFDDPGIDFSDPRNYFDRMGVAGIDEHTISEAGNDAYRLGSAVGTEPSGDVAREPWASDNRQDAIQYNVGWVAVGEWLNYTRTFPTGEYFVYARLAYDGGAFGAQLDRVTSDRTQPDQTTETLGTFRRGTGTGGWQNYQFIPLVDDDGNLVSVSLGGVETLRVTAVQGGYNTNFYMLIPADAELPRITNVSVSAGDVIDSRDGLSFNIESDVGVAREDIRILLNGEDRSGSATITGDNNEWAVSLGGLQAATSYQLDVTATDANGNNHFLLTGTPFRVGFETATVLPAAFRTPPGSGRDPGFTVEVFKAPNDATGFGQNVAQFEDLLAGNLDFTNEATGDDQKGVFIETGTINYEQTAQQAQNHPEGTKAFPGVEPEGDPNHFAVAVLGYLELEAGTHRFGFRHDDGFRLTAGPFLSREQQTLELIQIQDWDGGDGAAHPEMEFLVEEDGVYAMRLFMYEIGGGAYLEWYSIDPDTGDQILINDTSDARSIRAFQNREGEPQIPEPVDGVPAPSIVWDGSNHVISWEGTGFTLQSADELDGTWEAVGGATSPYTETENAGKRFYRLIQN